MNNTASFKVRSLTSKDWEIYKEIRLDTLKNELQAFSSKYEDALKYSDEKWKEILSDKDNKIFVANTNNRPIGVIRITINDKDVSSDTAILAGLYVKKDSRKNGVASELIKRSIDYIKENKDIKNVKLWVRKTQQEAVKLYSNIGFKVKGEEIEKEFEIIMCVDLETKN